MRMMEHSATADEQHAFAERLIAIARQLQARASGIVIEGYVAEIPDNAAHHVGL